VRTVFADAFFYIALLDRPDQHHARVVRYAAQADDFCVTTKWVLTEVANALSKSVSREKVGEFLADLEQDSSVRVVGESDALYSRGLALYRARADKHWSLTDCISYVVMEEEGLRDALTGDRHFEQAGFVALFAD
jgi:predicted nucleic acid-binding protein